MISIKKKKKKKKKKNIPRHKRRANYPNNNQYKIGIRTKYRVRDD